MQSSQLVIIAKGVILVNRIVGNTPDFNVAQTEDKKLSHLPEFAQVVPKRAAVSHIIAHPTKNFIAFQVFDEL